MSGYEIQFSAGAGGLTSTSQTAIENATELSVQLWLTGAKLRALASTPRTNLMWFGNGPGTAQKWGVTAEGDGSSPSGKAAIRFFTPAFADYVLIDSGTGTHLAISGIADATYYVLYVGYTKTTGVHWQEVGLYQENGTAIDEDGLNFSGSGDLSTGAGLGQTFVNFDNAAFSNTNSAGTIKRVAVWNKAIASANRAVVPGGGDSGIVSLWGSTNGFTAGSGTSEPNQVSGGPALSLSGTYSWNALAGGPSTPMLFHRFQTAGRARRR